jgi:hypothetical protein
MDEQDDPRRKMIQKALAGHLTDSSQSSMARMKLASYHAKLILGSYRADQANDPDIYITAIAHLLSRYPENIGARLTDPKDGIAGKYKWLPTVSEVKEEADRLKNEDLLAYAKERSLREQFQLRDQIEAENKAEPLEYRQKVAERMRDELREHGFKFKGDKRRRMETPESVRARLNITAEQWDALPKTNALEWNQLPEDADG